MSFPLYAIHAPVVFAAATIVSRAPHLMRLLLAGALLIVLVALALIVDRFIDQPGGKWLKRLLLPLTPASARA